MNSINKLLSKRFLKRSNKAKYLASKSTEKTVAYKDSINKEKETKTPTSVPRDADVVVIGGGSLGCSALYHLAKRGITNSVLLEAHQLTAGTTWHTAGLVWRLRPNDIEIDLLTRTSELLQNLEKETGINPGWINNGGLFIASRKVRLEEYKRLMTLGKAKNIESYVLDPTETKKLYPLMNVKDIYGTLYSPGDGTLEPAGFCSALARSATKAGAKIIEKCPVTEIKTVPTIYDGKKISKVCTPYGNIKTQCIINATGCWANDICKMVGVEVPLIAMKHAYVVTEKIPGIENMPNVRDHDASVYLRLQGDALSIGGYENNPVFIDKLEKDFAFGLYDLDWEVFGTHIEGAVNRVPCLEKTGIKSTVCGPESFTPDHKPIMGEDPNVMGFYHCCGFNSAGMMMSGGCGEEIAKWVQNGRPDIDMFGYDIRRFYPPLNKDKQWVKERSHESYAKNYSIVFPHDQPLAGRNKRLSPFHNILSHYGCVYQEVLGWERPGWFHEVPTPVLDYDWYGAYGTPLPKDMRYKSVLEADYTFGFPPQQRRMGIECLACRTNVIAFDMSSLGKLLLSGRDAQKAADWIFTANVQRKPGHAVYTCMLNEEGGTESDLTVSVLENSNPCFPHLVGKGFYMTVAGSAATYNWAHVVHEIRKEGWDVQFENFTEDIAVLSIQGRNSRYLLENLVEQEITNDSFPFATHRIVTIAGQKVMALRLSFVGELGWELHIPSKSASSVLEAVIAEGKSFPLVQGGYRALDALSAEKGYKHWHGDLRADDTPLEAGLGFTCKLKTSIPFLGRQALEKQKKNGLKKKLTTFTLNNPKIPLWGLETIWRDQEIVGYIRRAEYAYALGRTIAFGYVTMPDGSTINKEFLQAGDWQIESMGTHHEATLHLKHPFDPGHERIKGIYEEIPEKEEESDFL